MTLEKFIDFEKKFRAKYTTFDGHLYLHDINHFTSEESKILDSLDYGQDDDINDMDEGEEWKNRNKKWVVLSTKIYQIITILICTFD